MGPYKSSFFYKSALDILLATCILTIGGNYAGKAWVSSNLSRVAKSPAITDSQRKDLRASTQSLENLSVFNPLMALSKEYQSAKRLSRSFR